MEPSPEYAPIMDSVREKIYMSKLVIEFVSDNLYATYEDLLNKLQVSCLAGGWRCLVSVRLFYIAYW